LVAGAHQRAALCGETAVAVGGRTARRPGSAVALPERTDEANTGLREARDAARDVIIDRVAALDAQEERQPPRHAGGADVVGRARERERVGVALGQLARAIE